jgi:cellulose synthase/poly-beta-1,6-N-acetylglucosamine synthase-like glycosyltransferase
VSVKLESPGVEWAPFEADQEEALSKMEMNHRAADYRAKATIEVTGGLVELAEFIATMQQQLRARAALSPQEAWRPLALPVPSDSSRTSIIILTHNQLSFTEMCLHSLRLFTPEPNQLIVVDNHSTDGTVDFLRRQADVQLIENATNRGFPAGCNQAIRIATGDQILLLNNDTIVTPGWLGRLLAA